MTSRVGRLIWTTVRGTVGRVLTDALTAWNQFWFEPADPLMLGVIRLLTGWMLFYNLLVWTLDLEAFFGAEGLQPLQAVRQLYVGRHVFCFWLWLDESLLWPAHYFCLLVAAMFCAGLLTRVTSILAFLITISYSQRVPIANFGFDQILGMLCLYLCLAPSGAAVSLDRLITRWRSSAVHRAVDGSTAAPPVRKFASARMSIRLIQLHLCAIYLWAGFAKLKGPSWWTGEAMWRVIANQEYQTTDLTWMAWVPWLPYLIAHVTIIWEIFFTVLIWNSRLRPLVLAIGVGMHVGIGLFLGMWTFGLIMTFAYLAFADPDQWRLRLQRLRSWRSGIRDQSTSDHVAAEFRRKRPVSVLLVAGSAHDRTALRGYLTGHDFEVRAVSDFHAALELLKQRRPQAVIVHATGAETSELTEFVAQATEMIRRPVLVLLCERHKHIISALSGLDGADWLQMPVSLHEIREQLSRMLELSR